MTCIHGLDEINCPTCRILKSTVPLKEIKLKEPSFLKADDLLSNKRVNLERKLIDELTFTKSSISFLLSFLYIDKTAKRTEVRELESLLDLYSPIKSKFATRDEVERLIEERIKKKT